MVVHLTKYTPFVTNTSVTNVPDSATYSPIKYVINLFPNVRSQAQELAIDAMKSGL